MAGILDGLNDAQRAAVAHGEGPLVVLAGAGSGKTRVVTRRIARLLQEGVAPEQILAMTFTNKAAQEMGRRVEELCGGFAGQRMRVSTFHSSCARFLRRDGHLLGYSPSFSIYDTEDRDALIKLLMSERGLDKKKSNGRAAIRPAQVGRLISRLKNLEMDPIEVGGTSELHVVVKQLWEPYHERMKSLDAMDFDDLQLEFERLLEHHEDVRDRYRARFPWVLVDEFQDTNPVQMSLLQQLCPPDGNVCVVGDPDQSIYAFRGAEVRNILEFDQHWPDPTIVRLEHNYRSTATILHAAEELIRHNQQRLDKRLLPTGDDGIPITVFAAPGPAQEAGAIADRVMKLTDEGISHGEIAVFYRAHYLSRALEEQFRRRGISYELVGGVSFFERREIKDLLAFLRVVANPLDDVAMMRVINTPPRGIGKVTLDKIAAAARAEEMSLYEAVCDPGIRGGLSARARGALEKLAAMFEQVDAVKEESVHRALQAAADGVDYFEYVDSLDELGDRTRRENVEELFSDVAVFDEEFKQQEGESRGAAQTYLEQISLLTSQDRTGGGPAVQMMTVHAAKGLEFDHVCVTGLEEQVFPSARALEDPDGIEEERRLMYVALTRARQSVWLGTCRERMVAGSLQRQLPSRFLEEVPADCMVEADGYGLPARPTRNHSGWDDDDSWAEAEMEMAGEMEEVSELAPGMQVVHAVYGRGEVESLGGAGISAKARVRFQDGSVRTLILEYAGLRVVPGGSSW